jgi:hypothetical protein
MSHKFLYRLFSLVVLCIIIAAIWYATIAYTFLSVNYSTTPNILIVEGWLTEKALYQARNEFINNKYRWLITTGFPHKNGLCMASEGKMEFELKGRIMPCTDSIYLISTKIRGTKAKGEFAHYAIYVDTLLLGKGFSHQQVQDCTFRLKLKSPPSIIKILFDNDFVTRHSDRNLFIYSININSQTFSANNSKVNFYKWSGSEYILFQQLSNNTAGDAANYLKTKGIPDSVIIPIVTVKKTKSKTYSNALDVKNWIKLNIQDSVPAFTIFSQGPHARRSWLSYKKAFKDSALIGVVACPNEEIRADNWWKTINGCSLILYETIGLVLVTLFL